MFCPKCGKENENSAKFCAFCGEKLIPLEEKKPSANQQIEIEQTKPLGVQSNEPVEKKPIPKKYLFGGIIAVIAVAAAVFFYNISAKTINLDKYLTVKTSGYNGYGTAEVAIDWDAIESKYGSKITYKNNNLGNLTNMIQKSATDGLKSLISVDLEKSSGLSNDDVIKYSWKIDDKLYTYIDCKLKYSDGEVKVSGLKDAKEFDAFANVEITFDGISPDGKANLSYNGDELDSYNFEIDKSEGLSNGDKIKVTLNIDDMNSFVGEYHCVPKETEKEYTVSGLPSYISKLSDLNDDALSQMKKQAEDVYNSHAENNFDKNSESLESLTYIGDYLLTHKDTDSYSYGDNRNVLYLVYKAQVHDVSTNADKPYDQVNSVYWFLSYEDVKLDENGNLDIDLLDYDTPSNRYTINPNNMFTTSWYYYGFGSLDELYKSEVIGNGASYNHEDNVNE